MKSRGRRGRKVWNTTVFLSDKIDVFMRVCVCEREGVCVREREKYLYIFTYFSWFSMLLSWLLLQLYFF